MAGWFNQYQWLNACTGLEVHILPDQSYSVRAVQVSARKGQLDITSKEIFDGSIPAIIKKLPVELPVAITLTGKGVLTRQASGTGGDHIHHLFPNLDPANFCIQQFVTGDQVYVSLVRREVAEAITTQLRQAGLMVLSLSLGVFPVAHVLKQFNSYGAEIDFDGHRIISTDKETWESYRYEPGVTAEYPLKIDREVLDDRLIIAYATAFQLVLYNYLVPVVTQDPAMLKVLDEFREGKKFRFRFAATVVVFFVILLVNFIVFSTYHTRNTELAGRVTLGSDNESLVRRLAGEMRSKERLLHDLGWNGGTSYAFICDQVGQTVARGITLTELSINPVSKTFIGGVQAGETEIGRVRIVGSATGIEPVNEWIYLLKQKSWVKEVSLLQYAPSADDPEEKQFSLSLSY
ncbi:hypothetical protein [Hufsiella ginkgonis]|uniref:Uncharacterized protein n=1 Tax=Hufsiella ginkgonis TaxID=2695274 RepID=A0A7K1XYX2_9SPHI|nr:hypothetical protein [Hufsiella ginkgonis]MXV15756.1 hypothetical protein [Hufsiella ginkgonis]